VAEKAPTAEELRARISSERTQLTDAISDLREGVHSARRIPMIIGGALLAGIVAYAVFRVVSGREDD
jgi:hypothetical protein